MLNINKTQVLSNLEYSDSIVLWIVLLRTINVSNFVYFFLAVYLCQHYLMFYDLLIFI